MYRHHFSGQSFELPKSGLLVRDEVLYKKSIEGTTVAEHQFSDISQIDTIKRFDFVSFILFVGCTALAVVLGLFIPWTWLGLALAVVLGCFALICLGLLRGPWLRIKTGQGPVRYRIEDPPEEYEGFVVSLKTLHNSYIEGSLSQREQI